MGMHGSQASPFYVNFTKTRRLAVGRGGGSTAAAAWWWWSGGSERVGRERGGERERERH